MNQDETLKRQCFGQEAFDRRTTMKTTSTLLQILALSACFAVHLAGTGEVRMTGVRRALQTISISVSLPATQDASGIAVDAC
jgi:hypothetical protein